MINPKIKNFIEENKTKEQWRAIIKGYNWNYKVPSSCKVYCTNGDLKI